MVFFELFSNNPDFVSVEAGHPLFTEGEEGHLMFVLTTGEAEVIVNNRVVDTLQHGNIVGEMGMISPGPRSASWAAVGISAARLRKAQRFLYLVQQAPYFATQVMRVLAERLRNTNKLLPAIDDI